MSRTKEKKKKKKYVLLGHILRNYMTTGYSRIFELSVNCTLIKINYLKKKFFFNSNFQSFFLSTQFYKKVYIRLAIFVLHKIERIIFYIYIYT